MTQGIFCCLLHCFWHPTWLSAYHDVHGHLQQARPPHCSGPIPDSFSNLAYLLEFEAHSNSLLRDNSSERNLTPDFIILDGSVTNPP